MAHCNDLSAEYEIKAIDNPIIVFQVTHTNPSPGQLNSSITHLHHPFLLCQVESFSLVSDMSYVAQNASRIIRALFEIALQRGWPLMTYKLLEMCKQV